MSPTLEHNRIQNQCWSIEARGKTGEECVQRTEASLRAVGGTNSRLGLLYWLNLITISGESGDFKTSVSEFFSLTLFLKSHFSMVLTVFQILRLNYSFPFKTIQAMKDYWSFPTEVLAH